jgi:precorrin-6B methylase 1
MSAMYEIQNVMLSRCECSRRRLACRALWSWRSLYTTMSHGRQLEGRKKSQHPKEQIFVFFAKLSDESQSYVRIHERGWSDLNVTI